MAHLQYAGSRSTNKRRHVETDTISSSDDECPAVNPNSWPRFLVVEETNGTPLKINPFVISKSIEGIYGTVKSVTRLRSGCLLVECATKQQSVNLLIAHYFADSEVTLSAHKSLNTCKGIVRDRSKCLCDMSEDDIVAELKSQGVISVKRFTRKDHDKVVSTNTYLLTFALSKLPDSIKAGYFNLGVNIFIPNPLRCFKCQQFGHGARFCKNDSVCFRCSEQHDAFDCTNDVKCANCHGKHMSSSKMCPNFEREVKISKIKYSNNISFSEAKKLVADLSTVTPSPNSYSAAVSSSVQKVDNGCQTAISWVLNKQIKLYTISGESTSETQTETSPKPVTETSAVSQSAESQPETNTERLTKRERKSLKKKESRTLKHVEVPVPLTVPVEVHNPFEPLHMDITPQIRERSRNCPRSPVEPP
ncbi:uncharacterized protein [Haliotis asinina]|uniref:uncharacterized protein n=1 Tax=Haliotis asinina TaxID=109174 RepID=UPI00353180D2